MIDTQLPQVLLTGFYHKPISLKGTSTDVYYTKSSYLEITLRCIDTPKPNQS